MKWFVNQNRGFTLVEMIVSLAIFAIVAVVAVGSLVRITGLNRQAQSLQAAMNNVNFALESFSRELRVGSTFHCSTNNLESIDDSITSYACLSQNGALIAFYSSKVGTAGINAPCNLIDSYRFKKDDSNTYWRFQKAEQNQCGDTINDNSYYDVIDQNSIHITDYKLGVFSTGLNQYSSAFIRIKGIAGSREQDKQNFDLQTSVSQRIHD